MDEQEVRAIWTVLCEFIQALQQNTPHLGRWLVPRSNAAMFLDLYGKAVLSLLLKDDPQRNHFSLVQIECLPQAPGQVCLAEVAWIDPPSMAYADKDLVTLRLRTYRRRWRVEDLWPFPLDDRLSLEEIREIADREGKRAPTVILWMAGALALPMEGQAELDKVEALFVVGMDSRGFSPWEVLQAVRLWRDFRRKADPSYRKPAIFAAAVEYAFSLLGRYEDSSSELAACYGVSPNSMTKRFCEIRDRLRLIDFDPRYSVLREPIDILGEVRRVLGMAPPKGKAKLGPNSSPPRRR